MIMSCKECEFFDAFDNVCLLTNEKCFVDKVCLHKYCENFVLGSWRSNELLQ